MSNEYESTDRRSAKSPPNFDVMRAIDLDPEEGRADRWLYHGRVCGRGYIRSGFPSREVANRAAWLMFDRARAIAARAPDGEGIRAAQADHPGMRGEYTVRLDSWDHMVADLLAQVIDDAGSLRRAAKVFDLPKSTLARWIVWHKESGSWPRR